MEKYNYLEAVTDDVKEYIENEIDLADYADREELEEYLSDTLWENDSVTGNGSGSYTYNRWQAEEYLCHNLDLIGDTFSEFGGKPDFFDPEGIDVSIRCYLLSQAISAALDDIDF